MGEEVSFVLHNVGSRELCVYSWSRSVARKKNAVRIRNQDRRPKCLFRGDLIREERLSYKDRRYFKNRCESFQ